MYFGQSRITLSHETDLFSEKNAQSNKANLFPELIWMSAAEKKQDYIFS